MSAIDVQNINSKTGSSAITIADSGDISLSASITFDTDTLYVDASNNRVGIRTTSPAQALDVVGTIQGDSTFLLSNATTSSFLQVSTNILQFGTSSADPLAIYTNNAERMRIDSSGNVGIGLTPENSNGTWRNFEQGGMNLVGRKVGGVDGMIGTNYVFKTDNSEVYKYTAPTSRLFFDANEMLFQQAASGTAGTAITWSEAMRIDGSGDVFVKSGGQLKVERPGASNFSSFYTDTADSTIINNSWSNQKIVLTRDGNVGIGTTSPDEKLEVYQGNIKLGTATNTTSKLIFERSAVDRAEIYVGSSNQLQFDLGGSERMRIDSSGNLVVGTTTASGKLTLDNASNTALTLLVSIDSGGTGAHTHAEWRNTNGTVGSIVTTGSATAYNTSSDERLKENIVDAPAGNIDVIRVRSFDWKADGTHQTYGVIAQELVDVAPEAVTQGETDDDMWAVDYSKLVPMMIKEIQDLKAEVAALKGSA